jgi:hypothetical protein
MTLGGYLKKQNKTDHYLYPTYNNMMMRCYSKNRKDYPRYGGRGISVCERWRDDFWNFVEDMGDRPKKHTLDRINNDGDYSPDNCRWSTRHGQQLNKAHSSRPHRNSRSNHRCICWDKRHERWLVQVHVKGKRYSKRFTELDDAINYRNTIWSRK